MYENKKIRIVAERRATIFYWNLYLFLLRKWSWVTQFDNKNKKDKTYGGKKKQKKTLKIILNFLTIQQDSNLPL